MKLGCHIILTTDAARRIARVSPIVKCCDWSSDLLNDIAPGSLPIYRAIVPLYNQERMSPLDYFDTLMYRSKGQLPLGTVLEDRNECMSKISEGLEAAIPWSIEFASICHTHGYRSAGRNDANRSLGEAEVKLLKQHNFCNHDFWAVHFYLDGQPISEDNVLLYRKYHEWADGAHPPMLITEFGPKGIDIGGQGTDDPQLINLIIQFNTEMERDRYIAGAMLYTFGPTDDWIKHGFDFDKRIDEILPLYSSIPQPEVTMPEYILGFKTYTELHPEVGAAISGLSYDDQGNAWQYSEKGLLFWYKAANKIYFFLKA